MKCRSIACIWTEFPPPHKVTAAAVLNRPPTLYTAGSDGSIIWWSISPTQEIQPVAMLCGHAAPVADLAICCPTADSGDGERDYTSNLSVSNSADHGDLISVCTDGEMCVWSKTSGNCRRRRKMPPWVGSPLMVRVLPDNPRYVCIASSFIGGVHSFDNQSLDSSDVGSSKCTVVIVDTYSLTIVQTVFHGNLSIGPLRFMALVPAMEDMEKQFILLFDSHGKLQSVPILKEPDSDKANGDHMKEYDYNMDLKEQVEGLSEELQVVTIATSGKILAFLYRTFCIFRFVKDGTAMGEISFVDNQLYSKEGFINSHGACGIFLDCDDRIVLKTQESCDGIIENFVVWNSSGFTVVYRITYIGSIFNFELSSVISAPNHSPELRSSFSFIQLSSCLLRISSTCSHLEDPCLWKPHITTWSLARQQDNNTNLSHECQMIGEGGFLDNNSKTSVVDHNEECITLNSIKFGFAQEGRSVSSTMIVSEPSNHIPYAVVYGFHSGEIEVVNFNIYVDNVDSCSRHPERDHGSTISKQLFLGHTRSVVCLAAHRMVGFAEGWSFRLVLISGSLDCTIRLWDLDSSNIITIMHHHVAPVRQIILPSPQNDRPWNDCFLSVGEDNCVTLVSLQTLCAERMFPGHLSYPEKVVWDGKKGYLACLCQSYQKTSDALDVLYIWDIKSGTRERVLHGTASQSMFEHFCRGTNSNSAFDAGNTSASSFFHTLVEDAKPLEIQMNKSGKDVSSSNVTNAELSKGNPHKQFSSAQTIIQNNRHPISGYSPFPGIAALSFDLTSLMFPSQKHDLSNQASNKKENDHMSEDENGKKAHQHVMADGSMHNTSNLDVISIDTASENDRIQSLELCLLHFSLSFLHLWDVDSELDKLLITEMKLNRPEIFLLASGLQGDRGSLTLTFPNSRGTLELWKLSPEFTAMRALTMVSLAQRMISLSHFSSSASSALAAFYTRNFLEKIPDVKPPLLQLLVSFWQDESEYVRMAARSLFHCTASRAIPLPLCIKKASIHEGLVSSPVGMEADGNKIPETEITSGNSLNSENLLETKVLSQNEESEILSWLESFEMQDWISCIGGTSQDAMTSHIIVAASLTIWYPSLVKPSLAMLVVHPLIKLVMAMNGKYSSTAAELLAEGMESTWKACIASEIPRLIGDIFFQIECVSGPPASSSTQHPAVPINFQKTLVATLLPSLATADVLGFLQVIESQIWSTASDSPVHVVSLMTLIRIVRGSPRNLAPHLDKVVNYILQTMDPSNSVMRRTCLQSSMTALKEVVRVFPMVALNETSTRLAIGDAMGEVNNASIRVYDMQSMTKIKVLDASGPLRLPNLLGGLSEVGTMTSISALSFSPEGEGLVAFSENGLMIRWWSLGSAWWEKLSRNLVPVQCTKLIFVPPWEGFSPNSTRSSIMASAMGFDRQGSSEENTGVSSDADRLKLLILNLDLSYHLAWVGERKVLLTRNGHDLGTFQV